VENSLQVTAHQWLWSWCLGQGIQAVTQSNRSYISFHPILSTHIPHIHSPCACSVHCRHICSAQVFLKVAPSSQAIRFIHLDTSYWCQRGLKSLILTDTSARQESQLTRPLSTPSAQHIFSIVSSIRTGLRPHISQPQKLSTATLALSQLYNVDSILYSHLPCSSLHPGMLVTRHASRRLLNLTSSRGQWQNWNGFWSCTFLRPNHPVYETVFWLFAFPFSVFFFLKKKPLNVANRLPSSNPTMSSPVAVAAM
jgi:hypothetical protein